LTPEALESGYWRAYRDFYRWGSIVRGAWTHESWGERLRHAAYAGGWKKCEPMWDLIIRAKRASSMLPVLETVLAAFGSRRPTSYERAEHEIPSTQIEPTSSAPEGEATRLPVPAIAASSLVSGDGGQDGIHRLSQRLDVLP
jgi:hypothetical protein